MRKLVGAGLVLALFSGGMSMAEVPVEVSKLAGSKISLYLHPFLTAEELATLRLVASNEDALKLFVPSNKGFAAMAAAPDEGFLRNGQPVASAFAISDLPNAETAAAQALAGCEKARKGGAACVIILAVGR